MYFNDRSLQSKWAMKILFRFLDCLHLDWGGEVGSREPESEHWNSQLLGSLVAINSLGKQLGLGASVYTYVMYKIGG